MHRRAHLAVVVAAALVLLLCSRSFAWSTKEHIQLTRIAVERLVADPTTPAEMKQWLTAAAPGLLDAGGEKKWFLEQRVGIVPRGVDGIPFWAVMPDVTIFMEGREEKKVEPFAVPERLLHYIDLERFGADDRKREYRHELSATPRPEDIPRDMKDPRYVQAGMLPFRVEQSYRELVAQLRAGRLADENGQHPRDEHAAKWAGYLAHYLEDNTQPQHATIDYKSATYFADRRRAPNVHAQVEYVLADDENDDHLALRQEYWPLLTAALERVEDAEQTTDLWRASIDISLKSYDALSLIGRAAMKAAGQGGTPEHPQGEAGEKFDTETFYRTRGTYMGREMSVLEMKAYQQAWAVKRVQRLLRQAWDEAHAPHQ